MTALRIRRSVAGLGIVAVTAVVGLSGPDRPVAHAGAVGARTAVAPTAVRAFDEAGVSTGTGDDFTPAQWTAIAAAGFKLFITDPIDWSSECSDDNCTAPVDTCTVDSAAVAQIQDASTAGLDYAVYTRNPNCLVAAIKGLSTWQQQHMSFAVLDIETDPSVPPSAALVDSITALGVTPVFYSYPDAWQTITGNTTAYDTYALQDGEVPDWNASFPAAYPAGYPTLVPMPYSYGGWSGYSAIEQQQCCTDIAGIDNPADQVDLDAVNAAWLATLPQS